MQKDFSQASVYVQLFNFNGNEKSLIEMVILEENVKRHLQAFASELFNCRYLKI